MVIEGALSIFVAGIAAWLLPNWADNTPWLTPEETEMAQYRLVLSAGGVDESKSKMGLWEGAKLGAKDPVSLLIFLIIAPSLTSLVHLVVHAPPLLVDCSSVIQGLLALYRESSNSSSSLKTHTDPFSSDLCLHQTS